MSETYNEEASKERRNEKKVLMGMLALLKPLQSLATEKDPYWKERVKAQ